MLIRRRRLVVGTTMVLAFWWVALVGAADADGLPSGTVSLDDAVAAALAHDPALAAYGFEERARAARARQESRLPNPALATEVENFARFGGDTGDAEAVQTTVSVTQVLELGGKRARRTEVAERDAALARWDYARARLETATRTRRAFVAALLAQERAALAVRRRDLARAAYEAARRQREAGGGSGVEVARAGAVLAQQEALVARRERESAAARAALAATWGATDARLSRVAGSLAPLPAPLAIDVLRARLATHPELARFGDALARGAADVAREEARRVPDVAVRLGARRFVRAESNALVAEVSVPLPLFDRNADAVVEARERLGKTQAERRAAEVAADAGLGAEYAELQSAYDEARALDAEVVPRLEEALAATRRGYAAGQLRQLDVLDAERVLAEAEEEYLGVLARYHTASAELDRITGAPVRAATGAER